MQFNFTDTNFFNTTSDYFISGGDCLRIGNQIITDSSFIECGLYKEVFGSIIGFLIARWIFIILGRVYYLVMKKNFEIPAYNLFIFLSPRTLYKLWKFNRSEYDHISTEKKLKIVGFRKIKVDILEELAEACIWVIEFKLIMMLQLILF